MAPMKKATAMTKGAVAEALATKCELKKSVATKVMASLAEVAIAEVKKTGIFTIPGVCRIKTRMKPATKAGKRANSAKTHPVAPCARSTPGWGSTDFIHEPALSAMIIDVHC